MSKHQVLLQWIGKVISLLYKNNAQIGSQQKLANRLLCSRQKISNICRGTEQGLTLTDLYDICEILQVDPRQILPSLYEIESFRQENSSEALATHISHRLSDLNPVEPALFAKDFWIYYADSTEKKKESVSIPSKIKLAKICVDFPKFHIPSITFQSKEVKVGDTLQQDEFEETVYKGNILRVSNDVVQCWELHKEHGVGYDSMFLFIPFVHKSFISAVGHIIFIDKTAVETPLVQKCIIRKEPIPVLMQQDEHWNIFFELLIKTKGIQEYYFTLSGL